MAELVERLGDLTALRDRDLFDTTLVSALHDLLAPQYAAVHRTVGESGAERWLTRARMSLGDVAPLAESNFTEMSELPALDNRPAWRDCLRGAPLRAIDGPPATALFALATEAGPVGVVELRTERALLPSERRMVQSILRICRNFESLLDYSERDTLTGLLIRKTFDGAFLKRAHATALADPALPINVERRTVSADQHYLGLIDIDHFKRVNDGFGHLIGDEVLLLLSRVMRSTFRHLDRLYRFGGEEFVVLLRCADAGHAGAAFERLRANVSQYAFPQVGQITVSIGFTAIHPHDTPSGAFERADRAVYFAKGHGRNQVRSHEVLVASGDLAGVAQVGDVELF